MPKSDLILLALDDPQALQLFQRALAASSYRVAIAHDKVALDKALQESTPALVIISENLNGNSGLNISTDLLDRFPTLPILLFATQESFTIVKNALRVGVSDCLFPPLHVESIIEAIENCIRRAQHLGDWTRREVKRTTESLERRLSELQKMETVIDQIDDGVMILDEKQCILVINPVIRRAFGLWQDDDLTGKPVLDVIPHPDLITMLNVGSGNPLPNHEITFDDGRVLTAQYTPIPGIGVAITVQDITYLKQLDRLKSEFVNTVSHDLRSPLTAILGYVELLDRVGSINEQQRQFIQRIQLSVQNITALVNDLLELGRIEAGFDSQKELIPLEVIIRYALENLNAQILEKKQNLHLDLPAESPPLRLNSIRLRQMLDNLIGNAIKYTPEGGDITVNVEVDGDQVILHVSDTGPGIPPADQPHIFEKFYRASNVPKGVGGSGLGLAIVKSIVENHHGRIWVDSVLGQGSTFTVVLPTFELETVPASSD